MTSITFSYFFCKCFLIIESRQIPRLPCVCSAIDHRRRQSAVRTSVTHLPNEFLFSPHLDVICNLVMNRRTATWNLFVNRSLEIPENCFTAQTEHGFYTGILGSALRQLTKRLTESLWVHRPKMLVLSYWTKHSRPQSPRSFWPVAGPGPTPEVRNSWTSRQIWQI